MGCFGIFVKMKQFIFILSIIPFYLFSQNPKDGENEEKIPQLILCSSVYVQIDNKPAGSGLFLKDSLNIYFVTARHVLFNSDSSLIFNNCTLSYYSDDIYSEKSSVIYIDLKKLNKLKLIKYDMINDICIFKIATNFIVKKGVEEYARYVDTSSIKNIAINSSSKISAQLLSEARYYSTVNIGGDIFLFGYPTSISKGSDSQFEHSKPLLRKGVVAGKNSLNKTIIIDCPVYFGNSGGPVFEIVRNFPVTSYRLMGIATQYIPYVINLKDEHRIMNIQQSVNSGYAVVVPVDFILDLIKKF